MKRNKISLIGGGQIGGNLALLAAQKELASAHALSILEALLRLRQVACHRALLANQCGKSSSKLELLRISLAKSLENGHKALVFSQWTKLLDLVEDDFSKEGLSYLRIDGSTKDRAKIVGQFQSDPTVQVMLISLKAGGVGLNLTAADHVFILDPWWNPAVEDQAADRAHRIGQTKPVIVHRLIAKGTVEEKILELY